MQAELTNESIKQKLFISVMIWIVLWIFYNPIIKNERGIKCMKKFKVISDNHLLAECPVWNDDLLYFTDILGKKVYKHNPKSGDTQEIFGGRNVGGIALNENGGFICGCFDGIFMWTKKDGFKLLAGKHKGEILKVNDVTADLNGRFLFGTNYYDDSREIQQLGKIYSMDNNGKISVLDDGYTLSNGISFSPDNKVMYTTDSPKRIIYAMDYDVKTGKASGKRVFVKIGDNEGTPDGLITDSQGFLWSAQWFTGCVVRFDSDGKIERTIDLPIRQAASLVFGGKKLSDLYITTAGEKSKLKFCPPWYDYSYINRGGQVYKIKTDIQGLPTFKANIKI